MKNELEVIVLSSQDYRESDALLRVISKDKGLLTFVAKGLNKLNSKNRMGALPYGQSLFFYDEKEGKDIQSLHTAQSMINRYTIHEDLEKSSVASLVVEVTDALLKHEQDNEILSENYDFINHIFELISSEKKYAHLVAILIMHFLQQFGIQPYVEACVSCESTKINSISIAEGGFICNNCQLEYHSPIYDVESLKSFRLMGRLSDEHIDTYLKLEAPSLRVIEILFDFFEYHTGVHLNAWEFIRKWSIIK